MTMIYLTLGFLGGIAAGIIFAWVVDQLHKEEQRIKAMQASDLPEIGTTTVDELLGSIAPN